MPVSGLHVTRWARESSSYSRERQMNETQALPPRRVGAHLSASGTLTINTRCFLESLIFGTCCKGGSKFLKFELSGVLDESLQGLMSSVVIRLIQHNKFSVINFV
jgi:hypothetical protein